MSRWFRMYDEILDDPKVQKLPAEDFKAWVNLLCLASRNGGRLPPIADIAFALRMSENGVETLLERLRNAPPNGGGDAGLIDRRNGGPDGYHYAIHGWDKRQYKSDGSTERVKRYRQRSRNVAETASATGPEPESESDTEQTPPTPPQAVGTAGRDDPEILASDLCKLAGIAKPGKASVEHVRRWLGEGIAPATMRHVVGKMATNVGGRTLSLKRFEEPIRREHESAPSPRNGTKYQPKTRDEVERALALAEDRGWEDQAETLRAQLSELVKGAAQSLRAVAAH